MEGAEGRTLAAHCQNDMLHTCLQHVRRWDCRDWARRWGGGGGEPGFVHVRGGGGGGQGWHRGLGGFGGGQKARQCEQVQTMKV